MNVFYESFPDCITVKCMEYPIITDYREWIRFSDMFISDIPTTLKLKFLTEMFLDDHPDVYDDDGLESTITGITEFLTMTGTNFPAEGIRKDEERSVKGIYYDYDAPYIISAFLRDYRIDLLEIPYLHWWKFRMLLDGLDEKSQIKERMYYRTVNVQSIKDKEERKRILKVRRMITLPDEEYVSDGGIGNAFI